MMKISKIADYALLILSQMSTTHLLSANKISDATGVPLATTNKILKILHKAKICNSRSGKSGGFTLALEPSKISLLQVIEAIEGVTPGITQCIKDTQCKLQGHCKITTKMQAIDREINKVLASKSISDLI